MRIVRLAALCFVLALAGIVATSATGLSTPTGLHGFLLRADEPATTTFHRTPSFAWNPVPGATGYEFQLATSNTFRDNGILYDNQTLLTPVEAPPLTLPWITGSPHALYARVRAILQSTTGPWSAPFGFDVTPPPPPAPLSSYPGVLRWTPIESADAYQVWLIDTGKMEIVRSNVLDEREFYTFHQTQPWIGTVRWRVRALRADVFNYRVNGMPVAQSGAWSPVYSSSNPAVTTGPLHLIGTVSDVLSDGSSTSPAHETMPAFMWSGNQTQAGTGAELFRVEVFTDSQCLNRVYTGAVTGAPAWSPRLSGPLSLPESDAATTAARSSFLGDGQETSDLTYDLQVIHPTEQNAAAIPTTTLPGEVPAFPGTTPPLGSTPPSSGAGSSGSSSSGSSSSAGAGTISVTGNVGPPVDLWDTDWPTAGYYWTVIPVVAIGLGSADTTVAPPGSLKGDTAVPVTSTTGLHIGNVISIGDAPTVDTVTITGIGAGTVTFATPLAFAHSPGDTVTRVGGSVLYQDLELPEDVCAPPINRVQRFGISSEPSLTTAQEPFATGLSPSGRLTSAAKTPAFYSQPLVAWTPALGANLYEVQWSKTRYPFKAELDLRTTTKGYMTFSTSAVLPLTAGTWYYRVRGIDFNLPTGVQQMSWSDPEQVVVTKPKLKIVGAKQTKFKIVGGATKKKSGKK
ncbi:MAG: hypothetical protein ACXVRJ_11890 [Gaiellaceae bacterium]